MRILVVVTVFFPSSIYGGPATVALNLAKALIELGHSVTVITSDVLAFHPLSRITGAPESIDGIRVIYFPTIAIRQRFSFLFAPSLKKWLDAHLRDFDIVHIHFARDLIPLTVALAARAIDIPYLLQPHGMLGKRTGLRNAIDFLFTKRVLRSACRVLALQETERMEIAAIEPSATIEIIPNGVDLPSGAPHWVIENLSKRRVLFLGRLHPIKRVSNVIEAVAILMEKGLACELRIVGPDEGDLAPARHLVDKLGLGSTVKFAGPISREKIFEEFSQCSVYVLPSAVEYFPMTVIEALAIGAPTIVSNGIRIHELLRHHEAAEVVEGNAESIAAAIERILSNAEIGLRYSRNGKRLVQDYFELATVASKLNSIYKTAKHAISHG